MSGQEAQATASSLGHVEGLGSARMEDGRGARDDSCEEDRSTLGFLLRSRPVARSILDSTKYRAMSPERAISHLEAVCSSLAQEACLEAVEFALCQSVLAYNGSACLLERLKDHLVALSARHPETFKTATTKVYASIPFITASVHSQSDLEKDSYKAQSIGALAGLRYWARRAPFCRIPFDRTRIHDLESWCLGFRYASYKRLAECYRKLDMPFYSRFLSQMLRF